MDVVQFQEKLREICELGKKNGNLLTHDEIREHFAGTDLETSQMVKVLQYLKLQGIAIEGEEGTALTEPEKKEEIQSNGTSTPLTSEEAVYPKKWCVCYLKISAREMLLQRRLLPAFICRLQQIWRQI